MANSFLQELCDLDQQGLFSDRILSGRARRSEDKKLGKFGIGRSCTSSVLCQASWLRSTAPDVPFPGEKGDPVGGKVSLYQKD